MAENSYDGGVAAPNEPGVLDAKIAVLLGPAGERTVLAQRTVAGELITSGPAAGTAQVSINDTIDMLVEAVLSLGEVISDQLGAPYSTSMPSFLAEFASHLIETPYDGDDDERQAQNRAAQGLPPVPQAGE